MNNTFTCKNLRIEPTPSQCMEHYGCIYENNHLVTLLIDPGSGRIVDANMAACSFYGYGLQELRKMQLFNLNGETEPARQFFRQAGAGQGVEKDGQANGVGTNRIFYERHRLASGKMIHVEVHTGMITMLGRNSIYCVIHDISERVKAEERLKESEERYRNLVELCPEAILVCRRGMILFANKEAERLFGMGKEELLGKAPETFFRHAASPGSNDWWGMALAGSSYRKESRAVRHDGRVYDLELAGTQITYDGLEAVQLVLRDVTDSKKELARAVQLQERRHAAEFPLPGKAGLQKLLVPAETLSGDFYMFHKRNEQEVVGIIGDVTGKGIAAALNISALRVLFLDSAAMSGEPVDILQDLNRKVMQHMEEDYFAACCFHLDFGQGLLKAAGAGINEFIYIPQHLGPQKRIIKGAPIGMFADSRFDQQSVRFQSGDRFCFYSDGLEYFSDEEGILLGDYASLHQLVANTRLQDDCTWLSLHIE